MLIEIDKLTQLSRTHHSLSAIILDSRQHIRYFSFPNATSSEPTVGPGTGMYVAIKLSRGSVSKSEVTGGMADLFSYYFFPRIWSTLIKGDFGDCLLDME